MLTADLVRGQTRKGILRPRWIDPRNADLTADVALLIDTFRDGVGHQIGELDDMIGDVTSALADPIFWKGLVKLLYDRTTTETRATVPPATIREHVFAEAGRRWPIDATKRAEVLAAAAGALGVTPADIEAGLHADCADEAWLRAFDAPEAQTLLEDYNLALAQAMLLRAREVRVTIPTLDAKRARALFREMKFRRLLARVAPGEKGGWNLALDGPLSLFRQTGRYGLQLALFLPALARCPQWKLEGDVLWGIAKRPATLVLDQDAPLVVRGHRVDEGTWTSAEEAHFVASWQELDTPWRLSTEASVVDLDGCDVLLPDFVLRHRDGREALVEVVWAWRRKAFEERLALLRRAGPRHLIVVVAERGGLDRDGEKLADAVDVADVVRIKGVIPPRKIIEAAERVAIDTSRSPR